MAPTLNVPTPETQMPEREAILARLERLHPRIIDLSLGRIRRLLQAMGRPEQRLPPVVHIAGTNGKGSTLAFMRAALEAEGYRVHVYTSPHLVNFNERIRLDGAIIDDPTLRAVLEAAERANDGQPITFFEVTTAAAFLAFAEVPADILLLETGLGGRLDATNVIDRPLLTAISPISLDHQQFLGSQLAGIAVEKAGILKPEVPAVLAPQRSVAAQAIEQRASEIGAPLFAHGDAWMVEQKNGALSYRSDIGAYDLPLPNLAGVHQVINAGLAVACLERLDAFRRCFPECYALRRVLGKPPDRNGSGPLIGAAELRVVPGNDAVGPHADADALLSGLLHDGVHLAARLRIFLGDLVPCDPEEGVDHAVEVVDDLRFAVEHDAPEVCVLGARLDEKRHARVPLEVLHLLALAEGRHRDDEVVVDREPHGHRVREAADAVRDDRHGLRAAEELAQLVVGHLDLVTSRHGGTSHRVCDHSGYSIWIAPEAQRDWQVRTQPSSRSSGVRQSLVSIFTSPETSFAMQQEQ